MREQTRGQLQGGRWAGWEGGGGDGVGRGGRGDGEGEGTRGRGGRGDGEGVGTEKGTRGSAALTCAH